MIEIERINKEVTDKEKKEQILKNRKIEREFDKFNKDHKIEKSIFSIEDPCVQVRDRGWHNYTLYDKRSFYLELHYANGNLLSWIITNGELSYKGETIQDFIKFLNKVKKDKKLSQWKVKGEKEYTTYKNVLIIWTQNLNVLRGFFSKYITTDFGPYLQISNVFEFRDISDWNKDLKNGNRCTCAIYGQKLLDELFIPSTYFFITPNQILRRKMKKGAKDFEELYKQMSPETYLDYLYLRSALFGGLCYCAYPGEIFDQSILGYDLVSAYIYSLCCRKHVMSAPIEEKPENYRKFIGNPEYSSIGTYEITYSCAKEYIGCFKDDNKAKLQTGTHTVTMVLTSVDLELFEEIAQVSKITCTRLESYKMDYLPKYLMDILIEEFIKKVELKEINKYSAEYITQKVIINGVFGQTITKVLNEKDFFKKMSHPYLVQQWGIFTTAYTKKDLFEVASKVDGWLYSDTDSIYCYDTDKNNEIFWRYNSKRIMDLIEFCTKFGYDIEKVKTLGSFEKTELKYFRAFKTKEYFYIEADDTVTVKSAGIEKQDWNLETIKPLMSKDCKKIPSRQTFGTIGEGTYEEFTLEGEACDFYRETLLEMRAYLEEAEYEDETEIF